jgi:hypothetical protein
MISTSSTCIKRNFPATTTTAAAAVSDSSVIGRFHFHFGSFILMFSVYETTEAPDHLKSLFQLNIYSSVSLGHCVGSCIPEFLHFSSLKDTFL